MAILPAQARVLALTVLFSLPTIAQTSTPTIALECQANYRKNLAGGQVEQASLPMTLTYSGFSQKRYDAELNGHSFSLSVIGEQLDLLAIISKGPEYTNGPVSRGRTDSLGEYRLSQVEGDEVFQISCRTPKSN